MPHPSFARQDHRPWPLPAGPWRWTQSWRHLLFAHWRVPADALRPHVPEPLELEQHDGSAWVGVVPFLLTVRPRFVPPLPWISRFPELNVRTYVTFGGRPGVLFFSLDARSRVAVWAARRLFHLPYFHAAMRIELDGDSVAYRAARRSGTTVLPEFGGHYRPTGPVREAAPGSRDHFLTERYCLYAVSPRGVLHRAEVHHAPWPLQPAEAEIDVNSMLAPLGVPLPADPPLLHFARRVDVAVWPLRPVG